MEEFTKDELVCRLDDIINDKEAKMEDLAMLIFDPRFPAEFYEDAKEDLEQALAVLQARSDQRRAHLDS